MEPTIIVIEVNQPEEQAEQTSAERVATVKQLLEGEGLIVSRADYIEVRKPDPEMVKLFSQPDEPVAVPYQSKARVRASDGLVDIVGDNGQVIASFSPTEVRKAIRGLPL